ncbi:MAG: UDP-N-acetylmuramoyl-tripeptide--D-alanyl-D-alanine ligase [Myxococcales bacterium]
MIATVLASRDAVAWTGGRPAGPLPESFSGVSTDSREAMPGGLFVALRGERFDGHGFLSAAKAAGAAGALIQRGSPRPAGLAVIEVDDTLRGLGALGHGHRRRFTPVLVAVTGSVGKTTTKELLAAALSPLGPVLKTEGNLNNEIGVPLTLLGLRPEHRAAAIEMGMNHEGEIARLAAMAEPRGGIVTNVRGVHLESLGTVERVAEAKGELFRGLPPDGVAIAGADDPRALAQARASGRRVVTFGKSPADVQLLAVRQSLGGLDFEVRADGRQLRARLSFLGEHSALDACAALAAASACGVELDRAVSALAAARPAPHRLAVVPLAGGVVLLDDCYNANPYSTIAALNTLRELGEGRRLGALLGDMLELGPEELALHREVGGAAHGLSWLFAFGPRASALAEGAREAGVPQVAHGLEVEPGLTWIRSQLRPGDLVLLKGSRGMRMERFSEALGAPGGGH